MLRAGSVEYSFRYVSKIRGSRIRDGILDCGLGFAGIAQAQVSGNASLSGPYYFRQVLLITDSSGTNVTDTRSGFGTLTFDGNGKFTINGQQLVGTTAPAALTGSGTYAVKSGGVATLTNPLLATATRQRPTGGRRAGRIVHGSWAYGL